jgi:hypothetical protein
MTSYSPHPHKIIKAFDIQVKLETLYHEGITSGLSTGWPGLDEIITLKKGTSFYAYGQPGSGKTEFWMEVLINATERYGWKHVIYSPESGDPSHVIGELISKKFGKPFYKNQPGSITEQEFHQGTAWAQEYFRVIDPEDRTITVDTFFDSVEDAEKNGFKADTTLIDPWNEVKHDYSTSNGRQDVYLEDQLGRINRDAIYKNRINAVITHIQKQEVIFKDGKRFYPPPTPREIAGGEAWFRKGMNMLCLWRPPHGLLDEAGQPYMENEVHVTVHKYKPKGTGKRGMKIFYYDWKHNKYYEFDEKGDKRYAARSKEKAELKITPNYNHDPETLPF